MSTKFPGPVLVRRGRKPNLTPEELRRRDLHILQLKRAGNSAAAIGALLGISERMVNYRLVALRAEYEER